MLSPKLPSCSFFWVTRAFFSFVSEVLAGFVSIQKPCPRNLSEMAARRDLFQLSRVVIAAHE